MNKDQLLILPSIFMVGFFLVLPAALTVYYSFTDYTIGSNYSIIGFRNYVQIINDPIALIALVNNLKFMFLNLIVSLPVGLIVAVLVYKVTHEFVKNLIKLISYFT